MTTRAPCARLTTFITPHTSENPTAIRANKPPWSSPFAVAWRNVVTSEPGPFRLADRLAGGVDRDVFLVLDLDHRHRLGHVLARRVELDRPEERGRVQPGD